MEKVNYSGFLISKDGLQPDQAKVRSIAEMPAPKNKEEVRRFLGMVSYYRRFDENFGNLSSCLIKLTNKEATFVWTDETEKSFCDIKKALV